MPLSPLTSLSRPTPQQPNLTALEPDVRQRVLCLRLENRPKHASPAALAEALLRFTPRLHRREPNWIFLEVSTTAHLWNGEPGLLNEALKLCAELGFEARAAIADTPSGAQALLQTSLPAPQSLALRQAAISRPGELHQDLASLPLSALLELEGLEGWEHPRQVAQVISFFEMLGLQSLGEAAGFSFESLSERWGKLGALVWRRLHGQDRQTISPFTPTDALVEYVHLDFPISLVSLLLHQVEKSLKVMFSRLQGRCLFAQKLVLWLHCEYSDARHKIELAPATPSRNFDLFTTLLEHRLDQINLENPIRQFELEVVPCPEKVFQLDFFEPRVTEQDKLQSLMSLLEQAACPAGFFKLKSAVLPENTWEVSPSPVEFIPLDDTRVTAETKERARKKEEANEDEVLQVLPAYGKNLAEAPRPTRLLKKPKKLSNGEVKGLKLLSRNPLERLEDQWWDSAVARDYYFAISEKGQCLWVFQDRSNHDFFLHGYFD